MNDTSLPVHAVLGELEGSLAKGNTILHAPPGAGKTTVVPLALDGALWLNGGGIVMLEPRRLAARAAARRLAATLGEAPGQTVGYRMRLDSKVGPATRITIVTEGILTRMIQDDPSLDGIGLVIFDEFHERSLHADLGLALSLECQAALRPDLRVLVMSATLQAAALATLLDGAGVVECHGRTFPVETHYRPPRKDLPVATATAAAVRKALPETTGDMLVFLPGGREIRAAAAQLEGTDATPDKLLIAPLYGDLKDTAQELAIAPAPPGTRKIVLATNIAESSLTIDGVRCVVDSGLHNSPVFDPGTGMSALVTQRVSRASADQRRGRAGRTAPGTCIRLWPEAQHPRLAAHAGAQILQQDLAPLALELALWGARTPDELKWLDPPPPAAFSRATALLAQLGALDGEGRVTAHGRVMAGLGLHPRLAHMLIVASRLGATALGADIAAVLSERDLLRTEGDSPSADIDHRLAALRGSGELPAGASVQRGALARVRALAQRWRRLPALRSRGPDKQATVSSGLLLAIAYPDRIATRRPGRHHCYRLSSGRGACLRRGDPLAAQPWLSVASADAGTTDGRIFLAASLDPADIEHHFADNIRAETLVQWNDTDKAVTAASVRRLGALTLDEKPLAAPPTDEVARALLEGLRQAGLDALPWTEKTRCLRQRVHWLSQVEPPPGGLDWPSMDDATLLEEADAWLLPWLDGLSRLSHLRRLDLAAVMNARLLPAQHAALPRLAPTRITVPSGSRHRLDYAVDPSQGQTPVLRVKLQELFGLTETPRVAGGQVPVTVHLLSPAGRPVQVTRDLASFWHNTYDEVRRDLKGRYPKHYWPDDPHTAVATSRVRPRK